jgi:hypothetical protein
MPDWLEEYRAIAQAKVCDDNGNNGNSNHNNNNGENDQENENNGE